MGEEVEKDETQMAEQMMIMMIETLWRNGWRWMRAVKERM